MGVIHVIQRISVTKKAHLHSWFCVLSASNTRVTSTERNVKVQREREKMYTRPIILLQQRTFNILTQKERANMKLN